MYCIVLFLLNLYIYIIQRIDRLKWQPIFNNQMIILGWTKILFYDFVKYCKPVPNLNLK